MEIKQGTTRLVFVFPTLGFVIKFPMTSPIEWLKDLAHLLSYGGWKRLKSNWLEFDSETTRSQRWLLFRGLLANWNEYKFYQQTHHPFLMPTIFSLLGLFNIQITGKPCEVWEYDLWGQLYQLTQGRVFDDPHLFSNPDNFCFVAGKLRIRDYASSRGQGVIREFGMKILSDFKSSYSRDLQSKRREKRERNLSESS